MLTYAAWFVFWVMVTICALIGLAAIGLMLVAQLMPRESTGTFLHPTRPSDEQ